VGRRLLWGGSTLAKLLSKIPHDQKYPTAETADDETAAILFTSGSTGVPKGAVYSHGNFSAQVEMLRQVYDIRPGEIDLPTFPLFALFDPALGMTTVLPQMDFANPGTVNPRNLVEPIRQFGITNMFGSPAVLERLGRYGEENEVRLPSLNRVISAGAPVPSKTLRRVAAMLEGEAEIFTPYGATECLPVASVGRREILSSTAKMTDEGAGVCIGKPVEGMEVRVIEISDESIEIGREWLRLAVGLALIVIAVGVIRLSRN
jgi:acyl-coenzyme A synthetase/AMP-(fatty) acid ligase